MFIFIFKCKNSKPFFIKAIQTVCYYILYNLIIIVCFVGELHRGSAGTVGARGGQYYEEEPGGGGGVSGQDHAQMEDTRRY